MNKKIIFAVLTGGLAAPAASHAVEVLGKQLEIYGKVHLSADYGDNDMNPPDDRTDLGFSSNSTNLGFRGEHPLDNMSILYQIEQEISLDSSGGTFASRNSFLGLEGGFGRILAGIYDTPFKIVGSRWDLFADTVGDRRTILGASATEGNVMNQRARNALLYQNEMTEQVSLQAMYSTDGADSTPGNLDNNDNQMYSAALSLANGPLAFSAGYERWENLSKIGQAEGYRLTGSYSFGAAAVGLIYEDISSDDNPTLDRAAWGLNGKMALGGTTDVRVQYLQADDYEGVSDSGANTATIGLFRKLNKQAETYVVYTRTDNDVAAQYQGVDGGHGDEIKTDLGGSPSALSVGFIYKF